MKTRVALADEHSAVREMLRVVLEREGIYEVCGEARTGHEALKVVRGAKPRVLLLDITLPELNGLEVVRQLAAQRETRVLVFSGSCSRTLWLEMVRLHPDGAVHRQEGLAMLFEALRTVAAGGVYLTRFASDLRSEVRPGASRWETLTNRERAVLQMIAEGLAAKEIAERLGTAPKTVEHYRAHLMEKLGIHGTALLTRFAVGRGLVTAEC